MSDHVEDQIRLGLRLVAEDVQPPVPARRQARPSRRLILAFGLAATVAGLLAGTLGRSSSPSTLFLPDAFNYYKPASVTGIIGGPDMFSTARLSGVSAVSGDDVWVIGSDPCCWKGVTPRSLAWHWNGEAWRSFATPSVRQAYPDIAAVASIDSRDAWAVGTARTFTVSPSGRHWPGPNYALIEHWDGNRWAIVRTPRLGEARLAAVSAAGPDDVWTVGTTYRQGGLSRRDPNSWRPLLLHWDGATWRTIRLPWAAPGLSLDRVVATGPSSVWAVGTHTDWTNRKGVYLDRSILEYWDGVRWHDVRAPFGPDDPIADFSATSGSDAWAVGSYSLGEARQVAFAGALAAHWNGSEWQITPVPNREGANNSWLFAVAAARSDDAWAVGVSEHNTRKHGEEPVLLLEHWDGTSWYATPGPALSTWDGYGFRIAAAADGSALAVGSSDCDNVVLRWAGGSWTLSRHPPDRVALGRTQLPRCTSLGGFRPGPTGATSPIG
ncbi:MAG: hypothetical protein QOG85_349 [Gaiellaceae bacterium]|jgi:hypothetical protein|nr:hypothetical protein [Gaiellaceae bacterium]